MKLDLFDHSNIDVIIKFLEEKDIKLDILVGGPPCQGFSVAGPRDMNDKRNTLYTAMVELAERVKPQAVVLEKHEGGEDHGEVEEENDNLCKSIILFNYSHLKKMLKK